VYPGCHPAWTAASLAVIPFAPFATSAANTVAMEIRYLQRALVSSTLQRPFIVHCLSAAIGLSAFALDEVHPHIPCMHALWHLFSCVAVQQTLPLIRDSERRAGGLWSASASLDTPQLPQ
jgi:hypothetical protein